jgi:hypothetical protein
MIMEAMLILTLVSPGAQSTTSQMFSTMEACDRIKHRLEILYNRQSGVIRGFIAIVVCVDAR